MKALFMSALVLWLVGCFSPESELQEEKYSTSAQELVVCSSSCDPPTYDGNPVACASNSYCSSDASAAYCLDNNGNWEVASCNQMPCACGDGICCPSETWSTCSSDCPAPPIWCGDGICNGSEHWSTCSDCPTPIYCGNGLCEAGETYSCFMDCGPPCPGCHEP